MVQVEPIPIGYSSQWRDAPRHAGPLKHNFFLQFWLVLLAIWRVPSPTYSKCVNRKALFPWSLWDNSALQYAHLLCSWMSWELTRHKEWVLMILLLAPLQRPSDGLVSFPCSLLSTCFTDMWYFISMMVSPYKLCKTIFLVTKTAILQ